MPDLASGGILERKRTPDRTPYSSGNPIPLDAVLTVHHGDGVVRDPVACHCDLPKPKRVGAACKRKHLRSERPLVSHHLRLYGFHPHQDTVAGIDSCMRACEHD